MSESAARGWAPAPGRPLIHVHIPKTGGSTFNSILRGRFPREWIYEYFSYFNDSGCDESAIRARLERKAVILGHLDMRCLPLLPEESLFVSFLRDPVERVVSGYHNILRDPGNPAHNEVAGMDLATYLQSGLVRDVDNGQVRRLAGIGMEFGWGMVGAEHLALARANIDNHRFFIGITERFDESMLLLQDLLGCGRLNYVPVNVRRTSRKLPQQALVERIRALNAWDAELYKEYAARLERRLARVPDLPVRLQAFSRRQRCYRFRTLPERSFRRLMNRVRGKFNRPDCQG